MNAANTSRIRILVADDHPLVLRGLCQALQGQKDLEMVGEAADADTLLKVLNNGGADVVVLDLSLPGARGLDLLRRVHSEYPQSPVLVLSIHPEEPYAVRCIKAGASGYVEKSSAPETVVDAIRTVAAGKRYLSPRVTEGLVDVSSVREERRPPHETLSEREFQVMCRIAGGRTISEIAEELTLSVKTVSTYRARLLAKMGLRTNSEITRYVFAHELLPL